MAAYRLALEQGADFVEPDLRLTGDGEAAALGLQVIAWTFDDANFDATRFGSSQAEMECAFRNGVSAVFADFPATGVKAR